MACSKLLVPKIKHSHHISKKRSISKIKVTSNIFLICGTFRTLKYSNVGRHLDLCQTYRKVFGKKFQAIIILQEAPSQTISRCLSGFSMRLCIYKFQLSCTLILGSASGLFRHIQALSKSSLTHIQNLEYRWHIHNPHIFLSQSIYRIQGIFIIPY